MKKLCTYFAVFLCLIFLMVPLQAASAAPTPTPTTPAASGAPDADSLNCTSAVLMDASNGKILFSKKPDEQIFPASTTKLMTVLLLLENSALDDEIKCGREVDQFHSSSSLVGLDQNEKVTVKDMVYACLLASGNDAAAAAAVHVAGSESAFVEKMNEKAAALGLENTHFENAHGLQKETHYSTARDMASLARTVIKNETIIQVAGTKEYTMPATNLSGERELVNTNRLIESKTENDKKFLYEYATGMKTGSTPKAGNCLVASAEKDGATLIAAIFNDPTKEGAARWEIAKTLFEYGFSLQDLGIDTGAILSGDPEIYSIIESQPLKVQVKDADADDPHNGMLELEVTLDDAQVSALSAETIAAVKANPNSIELNLSPNEFTAPVAKGQVVGTATYSLDGQELFTGQVSASRSVAATGGVTAGAQASQPGYLVEPEGGGFNILWVVIPAALLLIILLRIMLKRRSVRRRRKRVSRRRTTYYNF